jgi:DNA-binding NarL/FixJ family response regulator
VSAHRSAADGTDRPATTVLVVDDHRLLADSLALALDLQPGVRCVGTAGTVGDALVAVARQRPDVVLMDLVLPGIDGVEGTRLVRAQQPDCRVLTFTGTATMQRLVAVAEAGATGFLPKQTPLARLADAIRGVLHDETAPAAVLHEVLGLPDDRPVNPRAVAAASGFTEREHAVLVGLSEGLEVKQVARLLGVTIHTCRDHVRSVRRKFGVHTQLAAVVCAAHRGMLPNLRGHVGRDGHPYGIGSWQAPTTS